MQKQQRNADLCALHCEMQRSAATLKCSQHFSFLNALGLFKYYLVLCVDRRSELKKNTATLEMSPTSGHMQSDFTLLQHQDTLDHTPYKTLHFHTC